MATEQEHFEASRKWQEYYDNRLRSVGIRAQEPILGETTDDYQRRVAKKTFLPKSHQLRQFSLDDIKNDALPVVRDKILDAVSVEAFNAQNVPPGELRKIERFDDYGKVKEIQFIGQESFVKAMGRPGRRVVGFRTENGFVNTSGTVLR